MALDAPIISQEEGLCPYHLIRTPSKVMRSRTPRGNDRPPTVQMSAKAGYHLNHAREARLGHHPLFTWAGGGGSMYPPMLHHQSGWWSSSLHDGLHDANVVFRCH
jgi:hypothetical protein